MTEPQITDCPHLHPKGLNRNPRYQWIQEANRLCDHPDHRYSDAKHVPVEVELERLGIKLEEL